MSGKTLHHKICHLRNHLGVPDFQRDGSAQLLQILIACTGAGCSARQSNLSLGGMQDLRENLVSWEIFKQGLHWEPQVWVPGLITQQPCPKQLHMRSFSLSADTCKSTANLL